MKKIKCPACLGTGVTQNHRAIGEAMRALRTKSLREVAVGMGITPSHLCYLEQGKRRWNTSLVKRFKEFCR